MTDRFPAQIWIGGQISRTAQLLPDDPADDTTILQGLIGALHDDGASHEFGDAVIPANCPEADLGKYLSDDGSLLHLKCAQAVNGEFSETEAFCQQHDIPYDCWSDHYGEYGAENVYLRPGMNAPVTTYADSAGKEVIDGETVRQALEKLDTLDTSVVIPLSADRWQLLIDAIRLLKDACPTLPPKLEVFNLHD